ncbi:SUKH-4 family immunity protein [Streptomyces sp. NPDC008001]|uniref:SUKH-4 family immunity protein n=1 Tax=Streptomyces sp. NPDC008001 TaxID=3364804 RepID=UPI0036E46E38
MDTATADGGRRTGAGEEERPERLTVTALPDGLTHGPTRRFLTGTGLPAAAADLDFTGLRAGVLEAFAPPGGGESPAGERLFVLGETGYCGSPVVLNGTTGEVRIAEWSAGRFRGDLLASGLPALAELIDACEAVTAVAPRAGGRGGPEAVAEVREEAERRMRAADPRLFAGEAPPAHWDTALLIRSLHHGARRGGPDGLMYEFGPELVEELASLDGEEGVHRYRPEELPAVLTHEPTRRLLTEVGLPLGGMFFGVSGEPLRTMAEAHPDAFDDADETGEPEGAEAAPEERGAIADRPYQRDFVALAWWPHDLVIALDGATGRLELPDWYDDGEPEAYLNADLSALLYAVWTYERLRAEWRRWEYGVGNRTWAVFHPHSLLVSRVDAMIEAIDPEAFRTPGHSWRQLAEDDHTGGLLA